MKKLVLVAAMALAGLGGSHAATALGNFNVAITLTSQCQINSTNPAGAATINDLTMAYTSFQTTAATGTANFNVRCTGNLPYTLALDATSVTDAATSLAYTLALSGASGVGTGDTAGTNYTVTGTIAAAQVGTCNSGTALTQGTAIAAAQTCSNATVASGVTQNRQRTVTVTY